MVSLVAGHSGRSNAARQGFWTRHPAEVSRDLIGWSTGVQALFLAPAIVLGGLIGERLFPLASEAFYRRLALLLLVGVAIGSLVI